MTRTLEDYALKSHNHARMTGVAVASHAIPDSFLLMHSGVGCKYKTASQGANHDLSEHPNTREAWTQVSEAHLIRGCATRIGPFARAWWDRRQSKLMVVVSAYFIELTGDDIASELETVEGTLPGCHMIHVPTATPNGGFYDGYAAVLRAITARMDWSRPPSRPREAAILGHFFHRHENDQKADVAQLKLLVKAAGLEPGAILLSGQGYDELREAPAARVQVVLPHLRPYAADVVERLGPHRLPVEVDLPMGFAGTRRFVRTLAEATGTPTAKIDAWLDAQQRGVEAALQPFTDRLRMLGVAIFADTPTAVGLVAVMRDLGVQVPLVGLRDQGASLGGARAFREGLARLGVPEPEGLELIEDPSLMLVHERVLSYHLAGRIMGMVSSTHEHTAVGYDDRFSPWFGRFEVGYPSHGYHAVMLQPSFGFAGVATWGQRLLNRFWEQRPPMV